MAELQVSKKSIGELFGSNLMQGKKFIVPEYQREYSWKALEQCDTLWEDITDHFSSQNPDNTDDYFLGTIVYYKNTDGNLEIIDGQQRVTSLFLLLRAVYKKLECVERQTVETQGLKSQIAPCIWDTHKVSKLVADKASIHIESQVATTNDNKTFRAILEDGVSVDNKDNYSKNYKFFQKKCDEYAQLYPYILILNLKRDRIPD